MTSNIGGGIANRNRTAQAVALQVPRARKAYWALVKHQPQGVHEMSVHEPYIDALAARLRQPRASLSEIATHIGVTKNVYASQLRRALAYAKRLERRDPT